MEDVLFRAYTDGITRARVIIGCSANIEVTAEAHLLPEALPGCTLGEKNTVRNVTIHRAVAGGEEGTCDCEVVLADGRKFSLQLSHVRQGGAAGSSINIAFVLAQLGYSDVGVIAPVGRGRHSNAIQLALRQRNVEHGLFSAEGTAFALSVQDPASGISTIFCEKPPYETTRALVEAFSQFSPQIFVATGVKPIDVSLIEAAFALMRSKCRVFSPHVELIRDRNMRRRLICLVKQSYLVHMNEQEAALFLGKDPKDSLTEADLKAIADCGARISVVTLGAAGSFAIAAHGEIFRCDGFPAEVKATCGAGDTHLATLLYYLWLGPVVRSFNEALAMASWVASRKMAHVGPWSGIPTLGEQTAKLKELGFQ